MKDIVISEQEFIALHAILHGKRYELLTGHDNTKNLEGGSYSHHRIEYLKTVCSDISGLIETLEQRGFIAGETVTDKGLAALKPYKVDCAVIMAAGFSSRCAPLSLYRPKGLFVVKGQVLIERQIEQLIGVGIRQIVVVVGYHKEQFQYLAEKYGVLIVENPEYDTRNNSSSLYHARQYLSGRRCYMCCADNWFSENVFDDYVYESYFAVRYAPGQTDEFCVDIDEVTGRCVSQHRGGCDQWYTMGQVFWDEKFSSQFIDLLTAEYDLPEVRGMLFDDFYIKHAGKFRPAVWKYPEGVIWEFDTIQDFCELDPDFSGNNCWEEKM